jgi:hypothetical protein
MTALYDIYVFTCAWDPSMNSHSPSFFLYPQKRDNHDSSINEIMMDCVCLYRLGNKTLTFEEKIEGVRNTEIDGIVIQWMSQKGIDHVRGGSFNDAIFSKSVKDHISKQIKYMNYDLDENALLVDALHLFAKDCDYSEYDKRVETLKFNRMIQHKIDKYSPKASIEDLDWLRKRIRLGDTWDYNFLDEAHIYERIIKRLVETYEQYKDWIKNEEGVDTHDIFKIPYAKVLPAHLDAPRLYFDARIVPEERKLWKNADASLDTNMFSVYELMIYTLQNRVDEFKFDIEGINFTLEEMKIEFMNLSKRMAR